MTLNNYLDIVNVLAEQRELNKNPRTKADFTRAIKSFEKMKKEYDAVKKRAEFLKCNYKQECSFTAPLEDKCAACFIKGTLK